MKQESKWLSQLRRKLDSDLPLPPAAPPIIIPQRNNNKKVMIGILMALAILCVCGARWVWRTYHNAEMKIITEANVQEKLPQIDSLVPPQTNQPKLQTIGQTDNARLDRIEQELAKNKKDIYTALSRVSLVGGILNQNTYTIANGFPTEDLIYINAKWKIPQMPNHLTGNESYNDFLDN